MNRFRPILIVFVAVTASGALANCGGAPGIPGRPGGGSSVDPGACGGYAKVDLGRKLQAFLKASALVENKVAEIEYAVRTGCAEIGSKLGMASDTLGGETAEVCDAVSAQLKADMKVAFGAEAKLDIQYEPAVCTVDANVAAKAAATCEGKATADIKVACSGTCGGTCSGTCDGTCKGSSSAGGQCDGECDGTCQGTCSGECSGSADVQAEATCEASAEVEANANVSCTKPALEISYEASAAADTAKAEATVKALKAGLPALLVAKAKLTGPMKGAVKIWAKTAKELGASSAGSLKALGSQAVCVSWQLAAAASAAANVQASMSVSVEASASVSGSAGM